MKANIYRQELRMHLRSAITWSVAIAALIFLYMMFFSSFAAQASLMKEMMSRFPPQLLQAFGMAGLDLTALLGFFSLVFLFVQICLAIQAANYGFGLASVEEREWTADFLLPKPVGRAQILTSKLLAALSALLLTDVAAWIAGWAAIEAFRAGQAYDAGTLALVLASAVPFQLFFLTVGLAVSLLVRRIRSVTPWAMGLGFGMYLLGVFGDMLGESALEKITPFKHFEARGIVSSGRWDVPLVLVSAAVIVVCLAGSYWLYARRDIPSPV